MNTRTALILALFTTACATAESAAPLHDMPDADLEDLSVAEALAGLGGAVAVYTLGAGYSGLDQLDADMPEGPCSTVRDERDASGTGRVTVVQSDCENEAGDRLDGRWTLQFAADGSLTSEMEGLTSTISDWCDDGTEVTLVTSWSGTWQDEADGTFRLDAVFEADQLDYAACVITPTTMAIDYVGHVEGSIPDWDATVSGSGEVGWLDYGRAQVRSEDVVLDAACPREALSGTTVLQASGHTAVITFDGDTTCGDRVSTWTFDGEERGAIAVTCSSAPAGAGALGLLIGALALGLRRRR